MVVNGLYDKLDRVRKVHGIDQAIEGTFDDLIARRVVLNHLIELMSKPLVTVDEVEKIQIIKKQWNRYLYNPAMKNAKRRL